VSVAVLPEAEEVELEIKPEELRIDTYRSSGPGGQHMQKTDSAVRITHIPTGIVASCQEERSQTKNKIRAMAVLRARLLVMKEEEREKKLSQDRKSQIGTGDRSEKIRTYNYSQNRVTDHRINVSLHNLSGILDGDIGGLIEALSKESK
jgi:peptide chain release factor 1